MRKFMTSILPDINMALKSIRLEMFVARMKK
jgi:hypothetical protein